MDKYDEAIEHLKKNPSEIYQTWNHPTSKPAGCLFADTNSRRGEKLYGCLTQIRSYPDTYHVPTMPDLTEKIIADKRIPFDGYDITVDNLHVFAEWQRELDKAFAAK